MQWFNFEIGIYNAYIPMILLLLVPKIISMILKKDISRALARPDINGHEKTIYNTWLGTFYFVLLISIFIPLVYTDYFTLGLVLSSIALVMNIYGNYTYQSTKNDKLINTGIYKFSRNPGYFSTTIYFLGVSLMANSLFLFVLTIMFFVLYQITAKYEERMCKGIYKNEFITYKKKTAKNFLFF